MKSARWFLTCVVICIVGVMLPVGHISAEEASCQSLASWYAANPMQMDTDSLIGLLGCVNQTIGAQLRQPPPGPRRDESDRQRRDRGAWPVPPAWSDERIESKPWDSD